MPSVYEQPSFTQDRTTAVHPECDISHDTDPQVRQAFRRALLLMERGIAVLIQGETGTGKEVLARALHEHSRRHAAPMVALNCASIPETLIESELFGYSRGAFSGALPGGKKGKVAQADGGTLFLDEIGDMPFEQQTRLLRVIAEREITPLGAERSVPVNFALICATHQSLTQLVENGSFREDLFYRIATGVVQLPPLRDRTDRAELVCRMVATEIPGCDPRQMIANDVWTLLLGHAWPGNLRQMRAVIRYACAVMEGARIQRCDLPADFLAQTGEQPAQPSRAHPHNVTPIRLGRIPAPPLGEREDVLGVLVDCRWNMTAAARALGICRPSLYRVLRRLNIAPLKDQLALGRYAPS
ncbi:MULTISPECIES: sigma-54-dependent Fis family transcriptional regulator [unclassified Pseudomonas]|jgi:transcriptional regulator of acetoin/glycerol metabolism|uniref:sigma-54-dependent Fis family transcriptional regulator n=1 Tax=unclassified Pseudomonas TaxID=196821 RepID=UPI001056BA08|nr:MULTISPECIES: sigma 54-interacting transcriptional regulator [unclassified Pseudomonas]MBW3506225.1 sigma 54-interacting transcriptional regulator [Pseudomonas sp. NKUCC02_KPG]MEC4237708.1 sigma 54-interacting transcriptional regulator [Pseudomonas sp. DSV-1]